MTYSNTRSSSISGSFPLAVSALAGLFFVGSGLWAMIVPTSFFDTAATFQPYNRHFVQDIGAFQIGLGMVLLLAARPGRFDGPTAALVGVGVGSAAHVVSHVIGRDLGGNPATDIPVFTVLALLLLVAGALRYRAAGPGVAGRG